MKQLILTVGMIVASVLSSTLSSYAYDFEVDGIYYNVLSLSDLTCEVTYNAENKESSSTSFYENRRSSGSTLSLSYTYPSYKGDVAIPATVNYKGRTLNVIGVGPYAFLNCRELTSLSLPASITNISEVLVSSYYGCYAGAFDYCDIETFSAGNAYTLKMFDQSYAASSGWKTKDHLKELILSGDFNGTIEVDYNQYTKLESLNSLTSKVPIFSDGTHFSNDQYLNLLVLVPEDAFTSYQSATVWKDFWDLKAKKSVKSITLNETSLSLEPKEEFQISATVTPDDAYDSSITWSSSDPSVATVDNDGLVTAITKGVAKIIVSANDGSGIQSECSVHVDLLVKDIQISETEIGLEPGESKQLIVTILPEDAFVKDVVWTSEDENIASIDSQGTVIALNVGTTNISVKTTDGSNLTATCKVTVANLVKSIIVTPDNATIKEGETLQLTADVAPVNATYKEVIWSSDNSDIASVDTNGLVTAISSGTTTIKASASDGTGIYGICEITVSAETIEYGGICYQRNSLNSLKIVPNVESPYSGDFFVPSEAIYKGSNMPVTEIGEDAFENCKNLTSVVIPNTITKIRVSSFAGCNNLNYVKICDGSLIEVNLDDVFQDSPITELYIGSNGITYNAESRLLKVVKSMTLGGSVTVLPPCEAFNTLNSFIVENGENPIVETDDYLDSATSLTSQQEIYDTYTHIYYRFYYLVTYKHLYPIISAIQNSTLNYLHIDRDMQTIEVDTSTTYEKIPTTAGSRYQEYGYMDEVYYQYQEIIVVSDYNRNPVESISISEKIVELNVGETAKLSANCKPSNASFTAVDWSSSDEAIAIVDIFGNVTKLAKGEVTITATTTDGSNLSASCIVRDEISAESITLNEVSLELIENETFQLTATVYPEDTTDKTILWTSSDENIATVDEDGMVKGVSVGVAIITAACGEATASCEITVISEGDGVEFLFADSEESFSIFSCDGKIIKLNCNKDDIKTLGKGIYIVVTAKKRYKISI